MNAAFPLARVKLTRPPLTPEFVARPQLFRQLNNGIANPVTLIAAPAGYGKSTLLTAWLAGAALASCWLSLSASDDELHPFVSYLVASIQTLFPAALPTIAGLVKSGAVTNPIDLATQLSNEIAELPKDFILVVDDYHCLTHPAIHQFVGELLERMPAPLHLVIATRTNASLPLGKLRARGLLTELRAQDLRFTLDESRALLERSVGRKVPRELMQPLYQRIEGWAAGLRFASLLLRQNNVNATTIELLRTPQDHQLMDYMLHEILAQRSAAVQEFMLKSAILERFSVGLCNAIMDLPDGANAYAILDELVRDDLLTVERDANARWYRYMDLLREFLRAQAHARFGAKQVAEVHRRASDWFVQQGLPTEAIQHRIAVGDYKGAVSIVGSHTEAAFDTEAARPTIEGWLARFPADMLENEPELLMARAWLLGIEFRFAALTPLLARIQEELATFNVDAAAREQLIKGILYHRIGVAVFTNQASQTLKQFAKHGAQLTFHSAYARGNLVIFHAWAHQMLGKTDVALQLLGDARQTESSSLAFDVRLLIGYAQFYLNAGDFKNAHAAGTALVRLGTGVSNIALSWGHRLLGLIHYEWNELEAAAQHFAAGAELRYQGNIKAGHEAFAWLALTQRARGLNAESKATMLDFLAFTDETKSGALQYAAASYRARCEVLHGKLESALQWALAVTVNPNPHMLLEVETNLTRLYILLATQNAKYLRVMLEETDALLDTAKRLHNTWRMIQLYALKAVACSSMSKRADALESLRQALELGQPGGFVRTFLDLYPGIAPLLNQLAAQKASPYLYRILAETRRNGKGQINALSPQGNDALLIQPLTLRELQVLQGLAERQTNKEIAQNLTISPQTVKAHVDHIHQKLGVNNRQTAVKTALELGIIEPPQLR